MNGWYVRIMETRRIFLIGVLFIALAAVAAPVLADTTGTAYVSGNPAQYIAITLNENSIALTLDPTSSPATDSSLTITASCNDPFAITVADNTARGSNLGYMGNYTSSAYDASPLNTKLTSALALSGTTDGTTVAQTITPPITDSPQTLYAGSVPVYDQSLDTNTFTQAVSYTDPRLPGGSNYRIDLIFTIAAA